jgi:hypothetical protein
MSIHFYQILNRHALLMDSEALFESGGMCLIKAITANIFNHERGSLAPDLLTAPAISAMSAAARPQQHFTTYWRGAMLPSEMVSFFSSLGLSFSQFLLQAGFFFPGQIFRFPVILATTFHEDVARMFASHVRLHLLG